MMPMAMKAYLKEHLPEAAIENRIERMESEADLVNYGRKPVLEDELDSLLIDEDIEKELKRIKSSLSDDKVDKRTSS